MNDLITLSVDDHGVADLRLNRPEKYNALSAEMFSAITAAGESLVNNRQIRAVVLSGNGKGFCAGLDFHGFQQMAQWREGQPDLTGGQSGPAGWPGNSAQRPAWIWKEVPVPVIAALHGATFGGGFQIALGADIRIASADARFSIMEVKWGLIPDMSITQTLRDLVRLDVAKELTFTGRVFDGLEAARLGLVTQVAEQPLQHALSMAQTIARQSPDAIRSAKRLYEATWRADLATGLRLEAELQQKLMGSKNQTEAVQANLSQRQPQFSLPELFD